VGALRNRFDGPRVLALGEWLLLGVLTWRLVAWIAVPEHRTGQADFVDCFYVAGWRFAHGLSPYGFVSPEGDSFYNPPWFALVLVPFSWLSVGPASLCWLALSVGLLVVSVALALRLCDLRLGRRRLAILCLALTWWPPVSEHLALGQSSLLVAACIFAAVLAMRRGHAGLAGLTLVMAASKPQLLFLLGPGMTIWEWRRQRSCGVLAGFTLGVAAALLICLMVTPAWVNDLLQPPPEFVGAHVNTRTLLVTAFGWSVAIEALYVGMALLGSAATLLYWARSAAPLGDLTGLTIAATLLLTPYAQLHDYVVLVLPLLLLAATVRTARVSWRVTGGIGVLSWVVVSIDGWVHQWIARDGVSRWLQSRLGERRVAWLLEQSQWNWRFIAMLLPLGLVVWSLSSPGTRRDRAAECPGRFVDPIGSTGGHVISAGQDGAR
jgi:hypothetical protein